MKGIIDFPTKHQSCKWFWWNRHSRVVDDAELGKNHAHRQRTRCQMLTTSRYYSRTNCPRIIFVLWDLHSLGRHPRNQPGADLSIIVLQVGVL